LQICRDHLDSAAPLIHVIETTIASVKAIRGGTHGKEPTAQWPRTKEAKERKIEGRANAALALEHARKAA
jgi:hypothetical protein